MFDLTISAPTENERTVMGMAEYIEREKIREEYEKLTRSYVRNDPYIADWRFDEMIESLPAADVAPVRHGRWDDEHKCTVCHNEAFYKISNIRPDYDYDWEENLVETGDYIWDIEWIETAYCPNCGCTMDLEG